MTHNPEKNKQMDDIFNLLLTFRNLCEANSIEYWIDGGSLLGAIREGNIIEWDDDGDVCVVDKNLMKYKETLKEWGFELKRTYFGYLMWKSGTEQILSWREHIANTIADSRLKGKPINRIEACKLASKTYKKGELLGKGRPWLDINVMSEEKGLILYKDKSIVWATVQEKDIVYPLKKCKLRNGEFNCPNDCDKYLTTEYNDWRTPQKYNHSKGRKDIIKKKDNKTVINRMRKKYNLS